jgi:hypothetical protein
MLRFSIKDRYDSRFLFTRKRFELLGYVPIGTYCYICGYTATHDYNNQRVCEDCFNTLEKASKETYVFNSSRYFGVGDNEWFAEEFLTPQYNNSIYCSYRREKINFNTKYPERMLQIAFSQCYNKEPIVTCIGKRCFNCEVMLETYQEVCEKCIIPAILYYFELEPWHYFYLKEIYPYDIVRYIILYYLEIKLRAL